MHFGVLHGVVLVSMLSWAWLLLFRGGFWRADQRLAKANQDLSAWPGVAVVIPARDEAATIADAVYSLVHQDYPGELTVIVVDDNSTDGTADLARSVVSDRVRVQVVDGKPLPPNWTGKMWAVAQGIDRCLDAAPAARFSLLTDADICHGSDSLRRLVCKAERETLDLVSLMVRLRCQSNWERLLIPAFVFFFQKLYPFPWINDPRRQTAGAAGGCMLVRNSALRRVGGISRIRDKVIDDCALAKAIKPGGPIWLGLAEKSHSLRGYDGLGGIWDMVARTAFIQLRNSPLLLAGTLLGLVLVYVIPVVAVFAAIAMGDSLFLVAGGVAWLAMMVAYIPTVRLYGGSVVNAATLPVAAVFYSAMAVASAWRTWRGRGAAWKGRTYGQVNPEHE
jgi:hopene-associated glycosyltransferase HpnB